MQSGKIKLSVIIGAVVVLVLLIGGLVYYRYTQTDAYKEAQAQAEVADLVARASKLMVLPEGPPAVFVIQDPELLGSQQAFFKGSQKDDRLLVYAESGKAIIYSPSRDIIVNAGPVTFDQNAAAVGTAPGGIAPTTDTPAAAPAGTTEEVDN